MTTIGVLGGMGPAATGQFLIELTEVTPASIDQDHLHTIIDSDPSIPDRTAAILAGDSSPLAPIRRGLERLVGWGAELLAVPCNTAHYYIDSFREELPVPLVHIVDATLDEAQRLSPDGAWLTATTGTMRTALYQRAAEQRGYALYEPTPEQQTKVMSVITAVKMGQLGTSGILYQSLIKSLYAVRPLPVVMACTELPLAIKHTDIPRHMAVSSLTALAHATCDRALNGLSRPTHQANAE